MNCSKIIIPYFWQFVIFNVVRFFIEELYILYRYAETRLKEVGASIIMPLVGRYATSMEMTGCSMTLCHLDDELASLLEAPAECAFWKV